MTKTRSFAILIRMSKQNLPAKIIVGIDPGSRVTGFGVLSLSGSVVQHVAHGVLVLDKQGDHFPDRMLELGLGLKEVFSKYKPEEISLEKIFLGKNADSAFKLGHARGVVMYEAGLASASTFEYATRVVKKSVTGNGAAEKEEVQAVLQALLKITKINKLDASDALALAYHHALEIQKKALLQKAFKNTDKGASP